MFREDQRAQAHPIRRDESPTVARAQSLHGALIEAGIETELSEDINDTIWDKFVFLTGLSAMTALTGHPVGSLREDPDTRELLELIMNEALRCPPLR
jgi:2-dehydropantoate 2-reductase